MLPVLVVDDNPAVCTALRLLFEIHDLTCHTASGPEEALEVVTAAHASGQPVGAVVQDMNFTEDTTSGDEGIRLFRALRAADPEVPVLLMTAWTHLEQAVQLVKEGAADYLAKPWDDAKLVEAVRSLSEMRERQMAVSAAPEGTAARQTLASAHELCGLVYESDAMHRVVTLALKVAAADVPVLVTGPNGAGKEKIAEIIQANSRRRGRPFVRVNAGALPESLLEAELFGAERGAFTGADKRRVGRFEAADGGTLFLDEIGNLSAAGQMKLLRVLQTGQFERVGSSETRSADVRVISATNADLRAEISAGRFREDLFFRLNVIEIPVPPLRARPDDVIPLAERFLEASGDALSLSTAARAALRAHDWSGNVRELSNSMRRAALLAEGGVIEPEDLALTPSEALVRPGLGAVDDTERQVVEGALADADGVVSRAADALGISRQALYRRMERLGISVERRPRSDG